MKNSKIATYIFLILFSFFFIIISSIGFLWLHDIYIISKNDFIKVKKNYIINNKNNLKLAVDLMTKIIENNKKLSKKELLDSMRKIRFNKDGYLFIYNDKGINLMHPIKPKLEGKNLIKLKDPNGKLVIVELIKAAKNKNHPFVKYMWYKPSSKKIENKIGYARYIKKYNWIIGSGIYIKNINYYINKKEKKWNSTIKLKIIEMLTLILIISIISIIIIFLFSKKISNNLLLFQNILKNAHIKNKFINLDLIYFKEFKNLAKYINNMLENKIQTNKQLIQINKQLLLHTKHVQMGEMINMIAHQWRQPLNIINSNISVIILKNKMKLLNEDTLTNSLDKISNLTEYLSNTIDDFRNFFKCNKNKEKVSFNDLIKNTLSLNKDILINNNIEIIKDLRSNYIFNVYKNEVIQVILNLLKNASDALIEKQIEKPTIIIKTYNDKLSIIDNAGGIDNKIIDKIFDPYFSTKKEKNGTGLGLYMSKTIIEDHCNGKLSVKNTKNGAIFTIKLKKA